MKYKDLNKTELPNVALDLMLMGGQSFCWDKTGENQYVGFDKEGLIEVNYDGKNLYWQTFPDKDNYKKVNQYFRLNLDHGFIHNLIFQDEHVRDAHKFSKSIRILKQDFEIAFFSFIISQNNSLPIIRHRIRKLNERYGKKMKLKNKAYYLFPETTKLANADIKELIECKLGYRAGYVKNGAEHLLKHSEFVKSLDIANINKEEEIRQWLMEVKGIGEKVADCILLYGLNYDNIFPMDLWGKRIMNRFYGISEKTKYHDLRNWVKAYFKGYAGWAGQYLFEYARTNWKQLESLNEISTNEKTK